MLLEWFLFDPIVLGIHMMTGDFKHVQTRSDFSDTNDLKVHDCVLRSCRMRQ